MTSEKQWEEQNEIPLCVDLDGTLLKVNSMMEIALWIVHQNPRKIKEMLEYAWKGKKELTQWLGEHSKNMNYDEWPVHEEVLRAIGEEHAKGRSVWLCTGAHEQVALWCLKKYPFFKGYLSSCNEVHLVGNHKAQKIKEILGDEFEYWGNEWLDLQVWAHAKKIGVVSANQKLKSTTMKLDHSSWRGFHPVQPQKWRSWLKTCGSYVSEMGFLVGSFLVMQGMTKGISLESFVISLVMMLGIMAQGTWSDALNAYAKRHEKGLKTEYALGHVDLKQVVALHGLWILSLMGFAGWVWQSESSALTWTGAWIMLWVLRLGAAWKVVPSWVNHGGLVMMGSMAGWMLR